MALNHLVMWRRERANFSKVWKNTPVELVRLILEFTACQDQSTAKNISLVSRETYRWMSPMLYPTLFLRKEKDVEVFNRICSPGLVYTATIILLCTKVPEPCFLSANCPNLRRLHICRFSADALSKQVAFSDQLNELVVCGQTANPPSVYQNMPIYANLTHLAFTHDIPGSFPSNPITCFPRLTHFACAYARFKAQRTHVSYHELSLCLAVVLSRVLSIPNLRVAFVLVKKADPKDEILPAVLAQLKDDPRAVYIRNYKGGKDQYADMLDVDAWDSRSSQSMWGLAEKLIREKK